MDEFDLWTAVEERTKGIMGQRGMLILDGCISYQAALDRQASLADARHRGRWPDSLWLLEHDPVFTLGRTMRVSLSANRTSGETISGIPVVPAGRGGLITYHGPGQVVGYPILRLREFCAGPKPYVRMLEDVIIRSLRDWDLHGRRREGLPGVWVGGDPPEKIASIGVRISQGITTHGFAVNVSNDLSPFALIDPCGIAGCQVTSVSRLRGEVVDVARMKAIIAAKFAEVFQIDWLPPGETEARQGVSPMRGRPAEVMERSAGPTFEMERWQCRS